jgi:CHAT domain-containing protein
VQKVLKAGEAAVEMVRFRNYSIDSLGFSNRIFYAILILTPETTKGPTLVMMRNGELLENRFLSYYRNGIQFKVNDEFSYKNYWETIHDALKRLNVKTIYLSTDGAYNFVAANSIKNPFTQKYLIEEIDIRLLTSTRDLLQPPLKKSTSQGSLLIGFPTYNLSGDAQKPAQNGGQTGRLVSRSIRGTLSRFVRGESGIVSLPGTKAEIEQISETLSSLHKPTAFTESGATESNIKEARNPGIVHIATHGYFLEDEISPELRPPNQLLNSGLILAGATNFIINGVNPLHFEDDGILTAYEAMNLNLDNTDIVVLSACETGLGKIQNGEGVYGLQRAFQLAGANHVIMSLWPVDDEATQFLMTTFYKKWVESENVRQAFREAQLSAMKKYHHPFYWGAFVLTGR